MRVEPHDEISALIKGGGETSTSFLCHLRASRIVATCKKSTLPENLLIS